MAWVVSVGSSTASACNLQSAICNLQSVRAPVCGTITGTSGHSEEPVMRGKIDCFGLTDAGKVREVNEDQFLIADLNRSMLIHQTSLAHEDHTRLFGGSQGQLLLVADGMGGHAGGQRASALTVETLTHYVLNTMPWFFRLRECNDADL